MKVCQMTPSCDLPAQPATPPSAIAAMLHLLEPHFGHVATTFTTIDFSGRFSLTAVEGHQRLNELAEDGLIASVPGQPVETWQLTRDGAYVLSPGRKRVSKKFIADVTACLRSIGPELLRQGAVELSIGGRPLDGKPTGQVLVGLRLKSTPFASRSDDGLLQQLCAALDAAVGTNGYAPMLFSQKVPMRLRSRTVIVAAEDAERARGDELIDEGEVEQAAWRTRFRQLHGLRDIYTPILQGSSLPWGLLNSLEVASFAEDLPLRGAISDWAPDDNAIVELCAAHADEYDGGHYRWRDWPSKLFAMLECHAAAHTLPQFFEQIAARNPSEQDFYLLNPLFDLVRWDGDFERATAHALRYYRTMLAETRAASAARVKPKLEPHYLLFFDTINFEAPRLIGFARQPAGHNAQVDELVDRWNHVLKGLDGAASGCLSEKGFNAGWLSLDVRAATPAEEAAFHEVCKREGTSFRYWLFLPDNRMGCRKAARFEYHLVELDTPEVFRTAALGRAIEPRLLARSGHPERPTLDEVIRSAPPRLRAVLQENIVFVEDVPMSQFARHAALRPCIDPVVLSTKLLEAWTFSAKDGKDWSASAGGDHWSVTLEAQGENLDLTVKYATQAATYKLAPVERSAFSGTPYDDTLGALLGLLSTVRHLCLAGLDGIWPDKGDVSRTGDDKQKLEWLSYKLCWALRGDRWGGTAFNWPYFPEERAEAASALDTHEG